MQSHSVELAAKILSLLKGEDFHDATSALKIAKILLPTPACQSKREALEVPRVCTEEAE